MSGGAVLDAGTRIGAFGFIRGVVSTAAVVEVGFATGSVIDAWGFTAGY
jgi:hypothetical protein